MGAIPPIGGVHGQFHPQGPSDFKQSIGQAQTHVQTLLQLHEKHHGGGIPQSKFYETYHQFTSSMSAAAATAPNNQLQSLLQKLMQEMESSYSTTDNAGSTAIELKVSLLTMITQELSQMYNQSQ